jgi:hypothetical protein
MNNPCNLKYGKVHTGDAWLPARKRFCAVTKQPTMSFALIVFGDKSHTDLYGTLYLTPIIFTLTLFNRSARNNTRFWRPLGYIPSLSHAKGVADRRLTKDKIQDEHTCISCILWWLCKISNEGGFDVVILGHDVCVKVWIHYFIGDTEGNNKWLGQYPGNREGVQQPYQDCTCKFDSLKETNPTCVYITLGDVHKGRRRKHNNKDGEMQYFRSVSRYDINNAFLKKHLLLSKHIHGPFNMMPPKLLHTSGSGLIMYLFESLRYQLGGGKERDYINWEHVVISNIIKRQSKRDFPIHNFPHICLEKCSNGLTIGLVQA